MLDFAADPASDLVDSFQVPGFGFSFPLRFLAAMTRLPVI